jgi:hypothetical protein
VSFAEDLAAVAKTAVCGYLANGGNYALTNATIGAALTPGGQIPAVAAGLGLMALNYGCNYNPNGIKPGTEPHFTGCTRVSSGILGIYLRLNDGRVVPAGTGISDCVEVVSRGSYVDLDGSIALTAVLRGASTGTWSGNICNIRQNIVGWTTRCEGPCTCVATDNDAAGPVNWPTTVTAPSGCQMTVENVAIVVEADGSLRPVLKISPAAGALATGGVIGGCNFAPIVYVGGGGGGGEPPWWAPWAPGPNGPNGEPWWYPLLRGAAAGATEYVVKKLLDSLFQYNVPATVYRLTGVCETNANGEPIDVAREKVIPAAPPLLALQERLDALPVLIQGLKDLKQPVCTTHEPKQGIAHRVRFISEGVSPRNGKHYIKEIGYRAQTERPLAEHRDHWKDFHWESGPFMVMSRGLPWGQPQVWAASFEEGRRVLTHAAAIAGVDLSVASHRWIENVTIGTRTGVIDRFGVARDRTGEVWVVTRTGSSGWPELAPELRTQP